MAKTRPTHCHTRPPKKNRPHIWSIRRATKIICPRSTPPLAPLLQIQLPSRRMLAPKDWWPAVSWLRVPKLIHHGWNHRRRIYKNITVFKSRPTRLWTISALVLTCRLCAKYAPRSNSQECFYIEALVRLKMRS